MSARRGNKLLRQAVGPIRKELNIRTRAAVVREIPGAIHIRGLLE